MSSTNPGLFSLTGENFAVFRSIVNALGASTKNTLMYIISTKNETYFYGTDFSTTINFIVTLRRTFFAEYTAEDTISMVVNVTQLANLMKHSADEKTRFSVRMLPEQSRVQCVFRGADYQLSIFEIALHQMAESLGQILAGITARK